MKRPAKSKTKKVTARTPTAPPSSARGKAKRKAASVAAKPTADAVVVVRETLQGGQAWSRRVSRGQILRITDLTGNACVSALFYNARDPIERYNMADTLKAQYTAFLTTGRVLYSDMGRVLMSIVDDTCGWHDTLSGCGDSASSEAHFGPGRYQELRNEFHRNARDNFIVELAKFGLGKRDIVSNLNFFVRVSADDSGQIRWIPGNSRPSAHVDLRCEMDTLVVLSNTPHPLNPARRYAPPVVALSVRWALPAERAGAHDPCRLSRPENQRGFALTEAYVGEVESGLYAAAAAVPGGATP